MLQRGKELTTTVTWLAGVKSVNDSSKRTIWHYVSTMPKPLSAILLQVTALVKNKGNIKIIYKMSISGLYIKRNV